MNLTHEELWYLAELLEREVNEVGIGVEIYKNRKALHNKLHKMMETAEMEYLTE